MGDLKDFQLTGRGDKDAIPLVVLSEESFPAYKRKAGKNEKKWLRNTVNPDPDQMEERSDTKGQIHQVAVGVESADENIANPYDYIYALSGWAGVLRPGMYKLAKKMDLTPAQKYKMALGWGLGSYVFDKYKSEKASRDVKLVLPRDVDRRELRRELAATYWVQDMINEPANVMGPERLTAEALTLKDRFNAAVTVMKGDELKKGKENYPLVYAVGRAAEEAPRVIDIRWGDPAHPAVTIAGKGVTFDTGGFNLKDEEGMGSMKNDMAGAAHALGLASMIMDANLPVSLRVILPVVENSINNKAYRQGDILTARTGQTIEVRNTDAEGRMIMSDVLHEASHPVKKGDSKPDLIVDFTTLGWYGNTELPGFGTVFSNKKPLQEEFLAAAAECQEYFAPRPLLRRLFRELQEGTPADLRQCNDQHPAYDDILAALLLHHNVGDESGWLHIDLQPWRESGGGRTQFPPHLPDGGFAMGMRSAFHMIRKRYPAPQPG